MNFLDWVVLISTLLLIIVYGLIKSKGSSTVNDYFLGNRTMPWYMVMFSVITTQASAITFISAPGQAYSDGMRFVQFYFGLPLAMLVVSFVFMPKFIKANVITAYQYLEQRFDVKTRSLAALLFLLQRSLSAGLTIYAPAVILSVILGWNIWIANFVMGGFVILYTVSGGSRAVAYTQMQQMLVITVGMCVAGFMVVKLLPENINFKHAIEIADAAGCMNTITTNFSWNDKYNIWSGLIGGFFLSLSYFGTDQSQVARYISAKNVSESRMGLLTTAAIKIPMQYLILLIGALLISLFHFEKPPVFFNTAAWQKAKESNQRHECLRIEKNLDEIFVSKKETARSYLAANTYSERKIYKQKIRQLHQKEKELRKSALSVLKKSGVTSETSDVNYVFLYFVTRYLPAGLIGLIVAVIFCASWSSTASELNALSSTTVIDIYQRLFYHNADEKQLVRLSRLFTVFWGLVAISVAQFAHTLGSMIEAVNVLGSLFYGVILGIFSVAFFIKPIGGKAVFNAAILAEAMVLIMYFNDVTAFLWLNVAGCLAVIILAYVFHNTAFIIKTKRLP